MENQEKAKNNAGSIKITTVSPIMHHAPNCYEKKKEIFLHLECVRVILVEMV